jgi:hypothetical protein
LPFDQGKTCCIILSNEILIKAPARTTNSVSAFFIDLGVLYQITKGDGTHVCAILSPFCYQKSRPEGRLWSVNALLLTLKHFI